MKKSLIIIFVVAIIAAASYYFLIRKDYKKELLLDIKSDSQTSKDRMKLIFDKMSAQELKDTYDYMKVVKSGRKNALSSELKSRIELISTKYQIFT